MNLPNLLTEKDIILHDSAHFHTADVTMQFLEQFHWACPAHLAYSLDLASSDFHLIGPQKKYVEEGKHIQQSDIVKVQVHQ